MVEIFNVSSCCSGDFADYTKYWQHNGFWLFNMPSDMDDIVEREGISRDGLKLFYYEVYERQFDENEMRWRDIPNEASIGTNVVKPRSAILKGFDVVSFGLGAEPECSPLWCNALADELPVNSHCLFETFQEAKDALESGKFNNSEPGPFRIFSVHSVNG